MLEFAQVVVCYQQREEIGAALDNVLQQERLPDRIVVGDDGSTDGSQQVIRRYAERHPDRIVPLLSDRNRGIAANLNRCTEACDTDYVSFLAADDRLLSGKFARQLACIREHHPEFRFFYSGYVWQRLGDRRKRHVLRGERTGDCFSALARRSLPVRNYWIHRGLLREIGGFDESLSMYEDWKMKLEAAARTPFRYCPGVFSVYRVHESGVRNRPLEEHRDLVARVVDDIESRYDLSGRERRYLEASRAFYHAKATAVFPRRLVHGLRAAVLDPVRWVPGYLRYEAGRQLRALGLLNGA